MKLRVRIQRQTERLELQGGEEASLTELLLQVQEVLLPKHGWSADTQFSLSLNGREPLSDTGQTLSSAGIVSGDLICVMLPQSGAPAQEPSTQEPSTQGPSTQRPSTQRPSTQRPSTQRPSTQGPSTQRPSTQEPSTQGPYTQEPYTQEPYTQGPYTQEPFTQEPFTQGPYTQGPYTQEPYTQGPYTQEPMLCSEAEDGRVPLSLELLHRAACGGASGGPCDAIMVAVHLLMLETGFMPQDGELRSGDMPGGWRSAGGAYKLQYTHPLCADSGVMVIGLAMGPLLALNATLNVNQKVDAVRKVCLNPSSYVANEGTGERPEAERTAAAVFRDLAKLSRTVKDQIAYPLIAAARAAVALPPAFGLCALPPELLLRVLRLLDAPSLVALSATNRRLRGVAEDASLWRHLYLRDFRGPDAAASSSAHTDWRELYKQRHLARLLHRRAAARGPWGPPPIYPVGGPGPFAPQPFPPHPPGIIGGEYDERPGFPLGVLPRPRYDPLGPFPGFGPPGVGPSGRREGPRPLHGGGRARDTRRGFI